MYSDLRNNNHGLKSAWTKSQLLAGLRYFYELNSRFPTAHEIDIFDFLPTSRSIQRSYGGLVKLRSELLPGEVTNFTTGVTRSQTAKRAYSNSRNHEKEFYEFLTSNFQEIAVHEHKLIRPGSVSCDFFVYTDQSSGVIIDIFYAASIVNLVNVVNIKLKRYKLVTPPTYLIVVGNDYLTQNLIDSKVRMKRFPLPSHVVVCSEKYFKEIITEEIKAASEFILMQ